MTDILVFKKFREASFLFATFCMLHPIPLSLSVRPNPENEGGPDRTDQFHFVKIPPRIPRSVMVNRQLFAQGARPTGAFREISTVLARKPKDLPAFQILSAWTQGPLLG